MEQNLIFMSKEFEIAKGQIQGRRGYQEDRSQFKQIDKSDLSIPSDQNAVLIVLADGMGGHKAGAQAAELAITSFMSTADKNQHDAPNYFMLALDAANRAISSETNADPEKEGMGCTLIGVHIHQNKLNWISVGDSLIYLFREGKLSRLNADHSLAPQLDAAAKRGEISWEEAQNSASRNALLSAVNGGPIDHVDQPTTPIQLNEKDWLIIASDGVQSMKFDEIEKAIAESRNSTASHLVEKLLKFVDKKGLPDQDNATVVALHVGYQNLSSEDDHAITVPVKTRRYPSDTGKNNRKLYIVLGLVALIGIISFTLFFWGKTLLWIVLGLLDIYLGKSNARRILCLDDCVVRKSLIAMRSTK